MLSIIGATHPGRRDHNEDCYIVDAERGIALVADGMGGYAAGEVASTLVKETVYQAVSSGGGLREAIVAAHRVVKEAAAADTAKKGMGSTALAIKLVDMDYEIAWVGDSRAYLWDPEEKHLKQITRDHSYVESLLKTGAISAAEALNHPNRNLITQAVGVASEGLDVDLIQGRLTPGQQLLLCSDGLVDEVRDHDIARLLSVAASPGEAVNTLIDAAVVAGGHDNITVVIAAADASTAISLDAVLPEVVRTTALDDESGELTRPRAESVADTAKMNAAPLDDNADKRATTFKDYCLGATDFIGLKLSVVIAAVIAAMMFFLLK